MQALQSWYGKVAQELVRTFSNKKYYEIDISSEKLRYR